MTDTKKMVALDVRILLDVQTEGEGADAMQSILTEHMQKYAPASCLINWERLSDLTLVEVASDYDPDTALIPEQGEIL